MTQYRAELPAWVDYAEIRRAKTGSWRVLVVANTWGRRTADPAFRGRGLLTIKNHWTNPWREYWLPANLTEKQAVYLAVNKAVGLRWISRKHWIIDRTRSMEPFCLEDKTKAREIAERYREQWGDMWLYKEKPQDEFCKEFNLKGWYIQSYYALIKLPEIQGERHVQDQT